jgi:predicted metal-dependent phosphotriesterase family hydrolase
LHPDGLQLFFDGMRKQGFKQVEIDRMSKMNPAQILGLD